MSALQSLLKRRFFFDQSFAIYGGISGLYDFGPMGCALKANMIQEWRKHFILAEGMLEVECSALTPEPVLKASGHVDRFVDWMVKDVLTGECFRADHLIKNHAEALLKAKNTPIDVRNELEEVLIRLDGMDDREMDVVIKKFNFKSPVTGNAVGEPISFNLMFPTQLGPTGEFKAFLRPETAQGIFINFKRLLEFNQGRIPFAAAQIGLGFRNEISPRQGLIRVREFTMCEIEHFVDPSDKRHPKFSRVADLKMCLFSACNQVDGKKPENMPIGDAVAQGIVDNETLGYYMARTHLYCVAMGIDETKLRFRQHMSNEMAHYAKDCWDAECLTSHGWIECVGNADRACYDLQSHAKATNVKLTAEKKLDIPKLVNVVEAVSNKPTIGRIFKKASRPISHAIDTLDADQVEELDKALKEGRSYPITVEGQTIELTNDLVEVKRYDKKLHVEEFVPSVVEPSFGIGRIMYAVLEHSFHQRPDDEQRCYLVLPPKIAPIKCSILPISGQDQFVPIIEAVEQELAKFELSSKIDDSGVSLGKRYARTDEIGIPFAVTVDFDSLKEPSTVTLRDLPTTQQIRLKVSEVGRVVDDLVKERETWEQVTMKYPIFQTEKQE